MARIPTSINSVNVTFKPEVNNDVTQELVDALQHTIVGSYGTGLLLSAIGISSVRDGPHKWPSRHVSGNAVDISMINGRMVVQGYPADKVFSDLVDALQQRFESALKRRENFGPGILLKEGQKPQADVGDHSDHVHFSVNGKHVPTLWQRIRSWFHRSFHDDAGISPECGHAGYDRAINGDEASSFFRSSRR